MAFDAVCRRIPIRADDLAIHFLLLLVTFRALRLAMHDTQCESSSIVIEAGTVPGRRSVTVRAILLWTPRAAELAAVRILLVMASGTLGGSTGKYRGNCGDGAV